MWPEIKDRVFSYVVKKSIFYRMEPKSIFSNALYDLKPSGPTDYLGDNHRFIGNCSTEKMRSERFHEREPWISYKRHLSIECHTGIEMISGILKDSGASRTRFDSFDSF